MSKYIRIALLILITYSSFIFQVNGQPENDSLIYWNINIKLKPQDFKANIPTEHGNEAAQSYISFIVKYLKQADSIEVIVLCYFLRTKSWINLSDLSILKHEQLHFDIGELYARKIRYHTLELKRKEVNLEQFNKVVKSLIKEFNSFSNAYDSETKHGLYALKQSLWEEDIALLLKFYKNYSTNIYSLSNNK